MIFFRGEKPADQDVFFDEYEADQQCESIPKTYTPKTMNNIYNEKRKIYQIPSFIQTIHTNVCL